MKNVILVMMALVGWVACTASQAQPADSTGAGRAISAQGTISSSTATTGSYTPTPAPVAPPAPPPAPVYNANRAWTLSFVGETKCLPNDGNYCFKINADGTILRIGSGESCWGQSTGWPIGSAPVGLVGYEFGRSYEASRGGWTNQLYSSFGATARPTQNAQGRYTQWEITISINNNNGRGYIPGKCVGSWDVSVG